MASFLGSRFETCSASRAVLPQALDLELGTWPCIRR